MPKWKSSYKSCIDIAKITDIRYNKRVLEGTKMVSQKEVDELYSRLNICNANITVRNDINKGTLDNKLNVNYSAICPDERCTTYSTGVHDKIKV